MRKRRAPGTSTTSIARASAPTVAGRGIPGAVPTGCVQWWDRRSVGTLALLSALAALRLHRASLSESIAPLRHGCAADFALGAQSLPVHSQAVLQWATRPAQRLCSLTAKICMAHPRTHCRFVRPEVDCLAKFFPALLDDEIASLCLIITIETCVRRMPGKLKNLSALAEPKTTATSQLLSTAFEHACFRMACLGEGDWDSMCRSKTRTRTRSHRRGHDCDCGHGCDCGRGRDRGCGCEKLPERAPVPWGPFLPSSVPLWRPRAPKTQCAAIVCAELPRPPPWRPAMQSTPTGRTAPCRMLLASGRRQHRPQSGAPGATECRQATPIGARTTREQRWGGLTRAAPGLASLGQEGGNASPQTCASQRSRLRPRPKLRRSRPATARLRRYSMLASQPPTAAARRRGCQRLAAS